MRSRSVLPRGSGQSSFAVQDEGSDTLHYISACCRKGNSRFRADASLDVTIVSPSVSVVTGDRMGED